MNSTVDDSKLNQSKYSKFDLELIKEEDKSNKMLKMEDIFFEKSGKQNSTINPLQSFEEVFDIHKYPLIFEPKNNTKVNPYLSILYKFHPHFPQNAHRNSKHMAEAVGASGKDTESSVSPTI